MSLDGINTAAKTVDQESLRGQVTWQFQISKTFANMDSYFILMTPVLVLFFEEIIIFKSCRNLLLTINSRSCSFRLMSLE